MFPDLGARFRRAKGPCYDLAQLVQQKLGVSAPKMDFLIEIMLICFQAMKESGLIWPRISTDEQERQMNLAVR